MRIRKVLRGAFIFAVTLVVGSLVAVPANAENTPPDLTVCDGDCPAPTSVCTPAGYVFTQTGFTAANTNNGGIATYTYEICNPAAGTCTINGLSTTTSCVSNEQCQSNTCPDRGSNSFTCNRDGVTTCVTDANCNDPAENFCSGKTVHDQQTTCVP